MIAPSTPVATPRSSEPAPTATGRGPVSSSPTTTDPGAPTTRYEQDGFAVALGPGFERREAEDLWWIETVIDVAKSAADGEHIEQQVRVGHMGDYRGPTPKDTVMSVIENWFVPAFGDVALGLVREGALQVDGCDAYEMLVATQPDEFGSTFAMDLVAATCPSGSYLVQLSAVTDAATLARERDVPELRPIIASIELP